LARRKLDQGGASHLQLPLSFARAFSRCVQNYGPVLKAFAALEPTKREELQDDLHALIVRMNRAGDGTMIVPSEYLEVVITKR
jgi:hypothetical protein